MQSYYTANSFISISMEHFPPGFEHAETSQLLSEVQAKENSNKPNCFLEEKKISDFVLAYLSAS